MSDAPTVEQFVNAHKRGMIQDAQGNYKINCSCGWVPPAFTLITTRGQANDMHRQHVTETHDREQYERNAQAHQDQDHQDRLEAEWLHSHH